MNAAQLLREWGFQLSVLDDDRIEIVPFSKLEDELKRWVVENKTALIRDIRAADAIESNNLKAMNQ